MEARARRYGSQTSPERTKVWVEPPPKHQTQLQQGKKIPVVYYLCRNRHLEHPHFIEVPLSSPDGLYLRDVINRLNVLRGKGMATMYSWSCKRSYKNGFVWHDLSDDDLVLPVQGNEYILKGSELLDQCAPDRQHHGASYPKIENMKHPQEESPNSCRIQEGYSSSSSPAMVVKEAKHAPPSPSLTLPPQPPSPPPAASRDEESCRTPQSDLSGNFSPEPAGRNAPSSGETSPSLTEYRVYKPIGAQDASTQTDDRKGRTGRATDTRNKGVSTDDGPLYTEFQENHYNGTPTSKEGPEIVRVSPAPTSSSASSGGRLDTLESLIRAEASKINSFRILEEEDIFVPMGAKLKASNLLMQLITCGSMSVKDHPSFGLIPTYRPRFTQSGFPSPMFSTSMMLGDLDRFSEIPRSTRLRMEEAEYFSGSLIETKKHKEEPGKGVPMLKRSSSFEEDRTCKVPDSKRERENLVDSASSRCLPRTIKMASCKQTRNETISSPISDTRNSCGPECSKSSPLSSSNNGSKRLTDSSSLQGLSTRLESFREEKEKVIKIEESLLLELGL
ncbi:protein SOSEKI 3-like [Typha angustifolia]|uniref:protein SOSEKI 3-like n=1 Tax=Typha angustifolia TaxID=59011 RepID=UPI003C2CB592